MKGRPDNYLLGHAAAKRQTQLSKGGATKAAGPHQSPNLGLRAEGLHMYKYIYIYTRSYQAVTPADVETTRGTNSLSCMSVQSCLL